MGKAINGILNRSDEGHAEKNVTRLSVVDVLHPNGSRERALIKDKKRDPHTMVVTAIRNVTYLYDNDIVSLGFEIVEEISVPLLNEKLSSLIIDPIVVGEVTRDLRTPVTR